MKRLLSFLRSHRRLFIGLLSLNFVLAGISIITPLVIREIVDRVILGKAFRLLPGLIAAVVAAAACRSLGMFFYQYGKEILGQRG